MPPLAGAIDVVDWGVVPNKDHPPVSLQLTAPPRQRGANYIVSMPGGAVIHHGVRLVRTP